MKTGNKTTLVGLIGWPVEHSVSPDMFNAAFQALNMNWRYEAFPVEPRDLARAVTQLRQRDIRGFNVTIPHKQHIMNLLDVIKPDARVIGAVNTVSVTGDDVSRLQGTNTDTIGFHNDLVARLGKPAPGTQAIILGAGGAARAAAYVLTQLGCQIYVAARNPARGLDLIREVQSGLSTAGQPNNPIESTHWRMQMRALPWNRLGQLTDNVGLVVNCTPVGMWPAVDESPWPDDLPLPPHAAVYDMVYRPRNTKLIQQATAAGLQACDGLGMLVQQGAVAFELWTGQKAPVDVMLDEAERVLQS